MIVLFSTLPADATQKSRTERDSLMQNVKDYINSTAATDVGGTKCGWEWPDVSERILKRFLWHESIMPAWGNWWEAMLDCRPRQPSTGVIADGNISVAKGGGLSLRASADSHR